MEIEKIPIDQFVCDVCNNPITDENFISYEVIHVTDWGAYCETCWQKASKSIKKDLIRTIEKDQPVDFNRNVTLFAIEDFKPEDLR